MRGRPSLPTAPVKPFTGASLKRSNASGGRRNWARHFAHVEKDDAGGLQLR